MLPAEWQQGPTVYNTPRLFIGGLQLARGRANGAAALAAIAIALARGLAIGAETRLVDDDQLPEIYEARGRRSFLSLQLFLLVQERTYTYTYEPQSGPYLAHGVLLIS